MMQPHLIFPLAISLLVAAGSLSAADEPNLVLFIADDK